MESSIEDIRPTDLRSFIEISTRIELKGFRRRLGETYS